MFEQRHIKSKEEWLNNSVVKIYTISATESEVRKDLFSNQLNRIISKTPIDWSTTASFAIFHEGATYLYLIFCRWGNDNELFTQVHVQEKGEWATDPNRYSFCVYDLEVIWLERNIFIKTMLMKNQDIGLYRKTRHAT
ncbi:hypothetical protein [Marinicella meishanensis]|uniref:hypothetical protein n=1 Tax=Marinicella meishanensis TaxID=2873263 RepID=UPI001CBFCB57|nr:hypothetical protein [Marinicella sp. NBU2979]